jgi:hypothetical protein
MSASSSVDDVRAIALSLPGVEEELKYGRRPSWRTKAGGFVGFRDDGSLIVWVESHEEKNAMLASAPEKFFTTPHYEGYRIVLVRVDAVGPDELRELVTESWRLKAPRTLVKNWSPPAGA